jgi:hypothetical protein
VILQPRFSSRTDALENHVLPILGSKPYEAITPRDLAALRDTIALTKGKHAAHASLKNLNTIGPSSTATAGPTT